MKPEGRGIIIFAEEKMAFKEILSEMHDMMAAMVESTDSLYTGLIYYNQKIIGEAEASLSGLAERTGTMEEELRGMGDENPLAPKYISVPAHIQRMCDNLERITGALKKAVGKNVLFSDKSLAELEYMFERARDIMSTAKDMVLARNTLVAKHMQESGKAIERTAEAYATEHKERVVEGSSVPEVAGYYLEMLEAFKSIGWHAAEIGRELV